MTFPFTCGKCKSTMNTTYSEVKLLKTVVSKTPPPGAISATIDWTILTCPKCKETFIVDPKSPLAIGAPKVHISEPCYETGK